MPLKIWLSTKTDIPVLGYFFQYQWVIYVFSWMGAIFDLTIPFILLCRKTSTIGFTLVVVFHVLTAILFPIGIFPYIMIISAFVFFDPEVHEKLINRLKSYLSYPTLSISKKPIRFSFAQPIIGVFIIFQLLFPFRYKLYPGELFWTEEGYRFSWRVMLMEKAGYANFRIVQGKESFHIDNNAHLTPFQEKQMAFQPDFILEFAHYLRDLYAENGKGIPEVYVESHVTLNGRRSRPFINPDINLAQVKNSLRHKDWILPFENDIKGI